MSGDPADTRPVRVEESGAVLVLTLDRPKARNAVNLAMARAIAEALDHLDGSSHLTAAVLTGSGGTFCAGMDLRAFLAGERPSIPGRGFAGLVEQPPAKPLIAAIEGYALAGGFEIALACDMIVAAEDAVFGLPEVSRSLVAAGGGLLRLPRRAPAMIVSEWVLTGRRIPAREAAGVGLVNRLVPPGTALAAALDLATEVARNGPLAVRASKAILTQGSDWSSGEAFERQREISEPVRASLDAREGARAFAEKRSPRWRGE